MNHLTKEQKKRFDDQYKFEELFKGDELIGLNILKKNIKQHLADEIARAREEGYLKGKVFGVIEFQTKKLKEKNDYK